MKFSYGSRWFERATLEELEIEREKVQAKYGDPEIDADCRSKLWDLLQRFNIAIGKKQWAGQEPKGPAHREDGWYILNKD